MDNFIKQEEEAIDQVNGFTEGGRKVHFPINRKIKENVGFFHSI